METPDTDLPPVTPFNDPRRKVPRWYLHDGTTPLESQSCGIAARLMVSGLLFDKLVARFRTADARRALSALGVECEYDAAH